MTKATADSEAGNLREGDVNQSSTRALEQRCPGNGLMLAIMSVDHPTPFAP
jgi:hypothetical protein